MKFHFTPEIFMGALLILWGASIIIKMVWGIEIPIFRPFLALFLIYLGLSLLVNPAYICRYKYSSRFDKQEGIKTEESRFTLGGNPEEDITKD